MRNEQIDELLCNIQTISDKTTEAINFLLDKENLDFNQIKEVYGKLEIICGKAVASSVFIEMNLANRCTECGGEKLLIDWDKGIFECQNLNCRCQQPIKPLYKLSEPSIEPLA